MLTRLAVAINVFFFFFVFSVNTAGVLQCEIRVLRGVVPRKPRGNSLDDFEYLRAGDIRFGRTAPPAFCLRENTGNNGFVSRLHCL